MTGEPARAAQPDPAAQPDRVAQPDPAAQRSRHAPGDFMYGTAILPSSGPTTTSRPPPWSRNRRTVHRSAAISSSV
jgi:hypothetical protein